ncbi:CIA30 family protein [Shewanella sp. 10N.286.54.B9]|uniref:CIA30 family protein n=1 Tax=Shewanella sp. 10N.286.54.B9 TaxID=3229719 RepID=UPI0035513898
MSSVSLAAPFTIEPENNWNIINDSVMGGVTSSAISYDNKVATFSGELSLDNNGGFASTRTSLTTKVPAKATHVNIRVKGDGRQYQLRLRTNNDWDAAAYSRTFNTEPGRWLTYQFSADEFSALFRGQKVNAPELKLTNVKQIGFLLADKQPGPFSLSFKSILLDCLVLK